MNPLSRFLGELKRRKVYRAAVVYSVASVAIFQAAESILPRLGLPDAAVTAVLLIALLGLPVALVLAWMFEVTSDGVVRTRPSETPSGGRASYIVAGLVLVTVLSAGWWLLRSLRSADEGAVASISNPVVAVLPFRDTSPTDDFAWLGEGIAELVLTGLARVPGLAVPGAQSSFLLADAPTDEIGARLGATHVLSGSVQVDGPRASVQARLIEVASGRVHWTLTFQPELDQPLEVQEQIARAVVDALKLELGPVGTGTLVRLSTVPEANFAYVRGRRLWNARSAPLVRSAIGQFTDAVERDPEFAAAWAGLSYAHLVLPEVDPGADVALARAESRRAAERALEIDPDEPDALTALGWVLMIHEYDWAEAERLISRALEIDSTDVDALHWQSHVVSWQGRHDEAVQLARKAVELEPLPAIYRANLAFILNEARDYDGALDEVASVLAIDPGFAAGHRTGWNVRTRQGRMDLAADALVGLLEATGGDEIVARELAAAFEEAATRFRREGVAGSLPADLVQRARLGLQVEGQMHAAVGDREQTLRLLNRAHRERAGARNLLSIGVSPLFDFLRDDPEFLDILQRVGLDDGR